jgi:hypothetical protein
MYRSMTGGQDSRRMHVAKAFRCAVQKPDPELHRTSVFDRRLAFPKGDHRSVRSLVPASKFVSSLIIDRGSPGGRRDYHEFHNHVSTMATCSVAKSKSKFSFSNDCLNSTNFHHAHARLCNYTDTSLSARPRVADTFFRHVTSAALSALRTQRLRHRCIRSWHGMALARQDKGQVGKRDARDWFPIQAWHMEGKQLESHTSATT